MYLYKNGEIYTNQLRRNIEGIDYIGNVTNTHIGINAAALVLGYDIEQLNYIGSGSNTVILLGNEGIRVILLLTNGKSNDRSAAEDAAEAAKQVGISIYAGGIGDSVNEDELNSLASYPPEEYRISIEDFTETALNAISH